MIKATFISLTLFSMTLLAGMQKEQVSQKENANAIQQTDPYIVVPVYEAEVNEEKTNIFKNVLKLIDFDAAHVDIFSVMNLPCPLPETEQEKIDKIAWVRKTQEKDTIYLTNEQALSLHHRIEAVEMLNAVREKQPELYPLLIAVLAAKGFQK